MTVYDILKRPVITEKSQRLELDGVYTFVINPRSTKVDVRSAVNALYGVEVEKVNIVKTRIKFRMTRAGVQPKRKEEVKALVTLKKGQTIADVQKIKIKD